MTHFSTLNTPSDTLYDIPYEVLGEDHLITISTMSNVAACVRRMGGANLAPEQLERAMSLYQTVLQVTKPHPNPHHHNLALVHPNHRNLFYVHIPNPTPLT